jgi:hypothetical protein
MQRGNMKTKENKMAQRPIIYQAPNGAIELCSDIGNETLWATQAQIALAFDVDSRTVNEIYLHLMN